MASKNTDIIEVLADTIVSNLTTPVSKRGKETAPNDKTFATVICGVNQKFTDDVSEEDKAAIIQKFSIPEAAEEGEQTYYTFKINGAYYCKRQNGDFKLYDKVNVYIPNGDWSNMYFDYSNSNSGSGGGSGTVVDIPRVVWSVNVPGTDIMNGGDLWIVPDSKAITEFTDINEDHYNAIYRCETDEDTNISHWVLYNCHVGFLTTISEYDVGDYYIDVDSEEHNFEKVMMCTEKSGSSSTWAEVYPDPETEVSINVTVYYEKPFNVGDYWIKIDDEETRNIEAFYQYQFNSETSQYEWELCGNDGSSGGVGKNVGHHNEIFNSYDGQNANTIENASGNDYNHAAGFRNSISSSSACYADGYGNSITGSYYCVNLSSYNTITGSRDSLVTGTGNTLNNSECCYVSGNSITVDASYFSQFCGIDNIANSCKRSILAGSWHNVNCENSFIVGDYIKNRNTDGSSRNSRIEDSVVSGHSIDIKGIVLRSVIGGLQYNIGDNSNDYFLDSALFGSDNNVKNADTCLIFGRQNTVTNARECLIGGKSATVNNTLMRIVIGGTASSGNVFTVDDSGNVHAAGTITPNGADYAEYFEWLDGNPENEDRRGMLVALDGDKIVPAHGDDFIGVISAVPTVVGNNAELNWQGKFKKDIYGKIEIGANGEPIVSEEYDPEKIYVSRSHRREWAVVGLIGRLVAVDNGECKVGDYIVAENGYGIPCSDKTNAICLKRIDGNHIEVLIK